MFVDNTKKIICLSIPGINSISAEIFFREQLQSNVRWMLSRNWNLASLERENYLNHPISEYDVYGVCRNPVDRVITSYIDLLDSSRNKYSADISAKSIIEAINLEFVLDNDIDPVTPNSPIRIVYYAKQILWLKHQDTNINRLYKYENMDTMMSDLCARYDIDASLYEKTEFVSLFNLVKETLPTEYNDKLLEFYAEDKALHDSL